LKIAFLSILAAIQTLLASAISSASSFVRSSAHKAWETYRSEYPLLEVAAHEDDIVHERPRTGSHDGNPFVVEQQTIDLDIGR
jgi:hypothetical protein